jgi:hypothetical protein
MVKDPLQAALQDAPDARELFMLLVKRCEGMPIDQVYTIAVNLMINAIRMTTPTRQGAEFVIDDLFRRAKILLLDLHYDSVTGKRKALFPYTQMVQAPFHPSETQIYTSR